MTTKMKPLLFPPKAMHRRRQNVNGGARRIASPLHACTDSAAFMHVIARVSLHATHTQRMAGKGGNRAGSGGREGGGGGRRGRGWGGGRRGRGWGRRKERERVGVEGEAR